MCGCFHACMYNYVCPRVCVCLSLLFYLCFSDAVCVRVVCLPVPVSASLYRCVSASSITFITEVAIDFSDSYCFINNPYLPPPRRRRRRPHHQSDEDHILTALCLH